VLTLTDTDKGTGSSQALPVLGTVPVVSTNVGNNGSGIPTECSVPAQQCCTALPTQQPQQIQPGAAGHSISDNGAPKRAQCSSQHSTAASNSGSATALLADANAPQHNPHNGPVSMQHVSMSLNLQPQQQQARTGADATATYKAAGTLTSTTSSDGGGQLTIAPSSGKQHHRRSSAGGMLSTNPGRPPVPHPIVGSQSLLHAMAAGYSQQALHRCV
jgi:hypothetical protein